MNIYDKLEYVITIHNDFVGNTHSTDVQSRGASGVEEDGETPPLECAGVEA